MPDEIKVGRSASQGMQRSVEVSESRRGGSMVPWIILAIVVIALVVAGALFRDRLFGTKEDGMGAKSEYQAVFLTNGQVYFGKMSGANGKYVKMTDIFYLQVTQPPLQGSQQDQAAAQQQQQLSLVKLGNELHGPVDEMSINRDQILFFEDMKADGKVVQAIIEYKKNPNPAPAQQQGTQQVPASGR